MARPLQAWYVQKTIDSIKIGIAKYYIMLKKMNEY